MISVQDQNLTLFNINKIQYKITRKSTSIMRVGFRTDG